jgi:hypothetical protein
MKDFDDLSYPVSITDIEHLCPVQDTKFANNLLKVSELFVAADNSELEMTFSEFVTRGHPFLI